MVRERNIKIQDHGSRTVMGDGDTQDEEDFVNKGTGVSEDNGLRRGMSWINREGQKKQHSASQQALYVTHCVFKEFLFYWEKHVTITVHVREIRSRGKATSGKEKDLISEGSN